MRRWSSVTTGVHGLRIGIPRVTSPLSTFVRVQAFEKVKFQEYFPQELDPAIYRPTRHILSALEDLGASLVPVSLPSTSYALSAYYVIASAEASSNMARYDGVQHGSFPLLKLASEQFV